MLPFPSPAQAGALAPVLRVRMTGAPSLKLSDFVHNDATKQCSNPDDCEGAARDEVQFIEEVSPRREQKGERRDGIGLRRIQFSFNHCTHH